MVIFCMYVFFSNKYVLIFNRIQYIACQSEVIICQCIVTGLVTSSRQNYLQIANSASNNIRFGYGVVIAATLHFCFVPLLYKKLGQRHRVKAIYDQSGL